jgi:hypothetical protein
MMPLPRLKVLQDTYCSQQVVNAAVGLVETHRPELIEKLIEEEHWLQQAYSEPAWDVIEYLTDEKVEVPTSLIGRMDLINDSLALSAAAMAGGDSTKRDANGSSSGSAVAAARKAQYQRAHQEAHHGGNDGPYSADRL